MVDFSFIVSLFVSDLATSDYRTQCNNQLSVLVAACLLVTLPLCQARDDFSPLACCPDDSSHLHTSRTYYYVSDLLNPYYYSFPM